MGRMIDILRTADRRPAADVPPVDEPAEPTEPEVDDEVPAAASEITPDPEPPIEDDDDVPYIEVGGPREPALRLIPPPAPPWGEGRGEEPATGAKTLPLTPNPAPAWGEGGDEPP